MDELDMLDRRLAAMASVAHDMDSATARDLRDRRDSVWREARHLAEAADI